jgi:hypothetical protein
MKVCAAQPQTGALALPYPSLLEKGALLNAGMNVVRLKR